MGKRNSHIERTKVGWRYLCRRAKYQYTRFVSQFEESMHVIYVTLGAVAAFTSLVCLVSLIVYMGYNHSPSDSRVLLRVLHASQIIFGVNIIYRLVFYFKNTIKSMRIIKWIVDISILISLVAWILPHFTHPWFPVLQTIFLGNKFFFLTLAAYSIVDICYALSYIPSRRTNPSLLLALSFLVFIIIGSFVLMLPRCTYHGISYFDSLFIASSAVSITGLSSIDIPSTFTPLGLIVLSILIQLGSLGIVTFTSFFALFFTGNTSIYNQLLLRDAIYSKSMNALVPTLLYVLGFTLTIEIAGAVAVYFTVPEELGLTVNERLVFATFHSMSSFCNAGFSSLADGMANPMLLHSNQVIYIVTSVLIFAGSIGFPILVNMKTIIHAYLKRLFNRLRNRYDNTIPLHIFDLNTKIVLCTTLTILFIGTLGFMALEYNNTLKGMSLYEKIVQSVFNSLIPRSAGFASVDPSKFLDVTIVLILIQMFIGGSSQSMAGGIKVNTLGTIILSLRGVIFGHKGTSAFSRTINVASVRRANAVLLMALISVAIYLITIMLLEPQLSTKSLIFETFSAIFTVGSSLGITSSLSDGSKVLLSAAMFLGRVGILSLLMGLIGSKRDLSENYPQDNVIIN